MVEKRIPLEPFDPDRHRPIDLGDGTFMTERTRTVQDQNGRWAVVPSVWFNEFGAVVDLSSASDDKLSQLADRYERLAGVMFPRFNSEPEATSWSIKRSEAGGATNTRLARRPSGR